MADHAYLAKALTRPFKRTCPRLADDLVGVAGIALCWAAQTYDPARSSFNTYAHRRIRWAIAEFFQVEADAGAASLGSWDGQAADDGTARRVEDREWIETHLRKLPGRHRRVMRRSLDGLELRQIGAEMGISKSYVGTIKYEALACLRKSK